MLRSLSIRNAALIEQAELEFSEGLNVLTGETGAGKSVILDCIDFVLGAKADKEMVRRGAQECVVRAVFTCDAENIRAVAAELDAEADDELVITRKLTAEGKSSLKVNGVPVTVSMLKRLTSLLVDVHGQSEHFFLLKESNQLKLLDEVGGDKISSLKTAVREQIAKRKEICEALALLGGNEGERARRLDILRYQIDELAQAGLRIGEEEELIALRDKLRNAEKIVRGLSEVSEALTAEGGGLDAVGSAARALRAIGKFGESYQSLADRLEDLHAELDDLADSADSELRALDLDEGTLERTENRLDEIRTLKKKYGGTVERALEFYQNAQKEYDLLLDSGERYEALTAELDKTDGALYSACVKLTEARKRVAEGFTVRVTEELKTLNIASARFEVEFDGYGREDAERATQEGLGGVRFLFSANAGEPLRPLSKIASGGEMSRFMLAVKAQHSASGGIGTFVFDEIDAGIGGRTARSIGEKFCKIARAVQVIAVSHLARIASFADRQFLIEKHEEEGRTKTSLTCLGGEARRMEIARLIGGDTGEIALRHADELLSDAEAYKKTL